MNNLLNESFIRLCKPDLDYTRLVRLKMANDDLLRNLQQLEISLHQPEVHRDPARLHELLHASFAAFGRSGRSYIRTDILELLSHEGTPTDAFAKNST